MLLMSKSSRRSNILQKQKEKKYIKKRKIKRGLGEMLTYYMFENFRDFMYVSNYVVSELLL